MSSSTSASSIESVVEVVATDIRLEPALLARVGLVGVEAFHTELPPVIGLPNFFRVLLLSAEGLLIVFSTCFSYSSSDVGLLAIFRWVIAAPVVSYFACARNEESLIKRHCGPPGLVL